MSSEADALRVDLRRFVSDHLLANLFLHALNAANESDVWEFPHVEYAGLVRWHDVQDDEAAILPSGQDVERIVKALRHLFFTVQVFYGTQAQAANEMRDRAEIAHRLRSAGLGIRVRAYEVHEKRVLRGLFAPFATELKVALGFGIEDVIQIFDAIPNILMRTYVQFREAYTGSGDPESVDRHHQTAGDYLTFNSAALSAETSLSFDVVEAVLSVFSLKRGEPDNFALEPSPFSILRQKPLLATGNGRYFLPSLALLFPAVQSRLEDLLNPDVTVGAAEGFWNRYSRDRGDWVEREAYRLLETMMPHGRGVIGAYYDSVDDGRRVEGDVVYHVDDAVFLLEGKAGAFKPPSLRGAANSLDSDVAAIITKGHDQAVRAEAYLRSGAREFLDEHGDSQFTLTGHIREIIRVVITLDTVGVLSTAAALMSRGGYMTGEPTWVVSLIDLMVIAEGMAAPGEFRHFARRRYAALLDERVLVWDELDHLGIYQVHNEMDIMPPSVASEPDDAGDLLDDNLAALSAEPDAGESATSPGDIIVPIGYTDAHDAFYVQGVGDGPPHQQLPHVFDELVQALSRRHDALWSQAVCDLFNLGLESRQDLSDSIASRMELGYERPRSLTVAGGDGAWALTVIVMPCVALRDFMEAFLTSLVGSGLLSPGRIRLVITWNPVAGEAIADYYTLSDEKYVCVPPALFWKSSITTE